MKLDATPLALPGCFSARLTTFEDSRGSFQKLFHAGGFGMYLPGYLPQEIYLTTSAKGVLRGMHFQLPPDDHAKVVVCLGGKVTDVLLDLRPGATYGETVAVELAPDGQNAVLLPKGIAHGFYAKADDSALLYLVETGHSPENDKGILWNSFAFDWPNEAPILSARDTQHPPFAKFSPPSDWERII
ncbi:dTDP-4-dehydrorhamnose 3,5-epimerase family protein [Roseovarius sp. S4756]|uniref:dTDP-4-dehydrorhamnose 3,5-epimerase family protein n=1 Tax=Roseovarius maritimus TaxID=3342637 RepID=UPI0037284E0D